MKRLTLTWQIPICFGHLPRSGTWLGFALGFARHQLANASLVLPPERVCGFAFGVAQQVLVELTASTNNHAKETMSRCQTRQA